MYQYPEVSHNTLSRMAEVQIVDWGIATNKNNLVVNYYDESLGVYETARVDSLPQLNSENLDILLSHPKTIIYNHQKLLGSNYTWDVTISDVNEDYEKRAVVEEKDELNTSLLMPETYDTSSVSFN